MRNHVKNIVVTICFITIISGFMVANIIMPDAEFSDSERRRLKSTPKYSSEKLLSGDLFEEFEKYFLDQFVFREPFRALKAFGTYFLLNKKDNNNIYIVDGNINKMEYLLNEKSILHAAEKLNEIYSKYLTGMNVNYAIIPDKNYFLAAENGYLSMDYGNLLKIMNENVHHMNYIDLFDSLTIADYYKTDLHWSQDKLLNIAGKLLKEMKNEIDVSNIEYTKKSLSPFYGSYYGQAGIKGSSESLLYLTNETLDEAVVYDYESKTYGKVYMPDKFGGMDPYDVFLSGAKPLISVMNPKCKTNKELILFRDSFGSSIAPLMLSGYSKITLIDLRYITTDLLGSFIEFKKDQDILFLYNTQILNNSYMLK